MDFNKAFNIGTDYKDRKASPLWDMPLFAEVVFIDKSQESAAPRLYQLKNNAISIDEAVQWKTTPSFFEKEAFALLGEVVAIDKKGKRIFLSNQNTVAYHYLVIASGSKPVFTFYGKDCAAGLQSLLDALRVKLKISSSFANPCKSPAKLFTVLSEIITAKQDHLDKIIHPYITSAGSNSVNFEFNSINKRLFEVQL